MPKVGILNFCSGFRWTAVLESVQRNPVTNAVTLQSIPLFWRFFCSEFRCKALDSTIKYPKIRILHWIPLNTAVDSTERCSGLHRWPQWTPPVAAVESTIGCSGLHYSVLVEFTELFHLIISLNYSNTNLQKLSTIEKKWSSCTSVPESSSFTSSVLRMRNFFRISKCHKKKDSEFLHMANYSQRVFVNQAAFYRFSLTVIFSYFDWIIVGIKISDTRSPVTSTIVTCLKNSKKSECSTISGHFPQMVSSSAQRPVPRIANDENHNCHDGEPKNRLRKGHFFSKC